MVTLMAWLHRNNINRMLDCDPERLAHHVTTVAAREAGVPIVCMILTAILWPF